MTAQAIKFKCFTYLLIYFSTLIFNLCFQDVYLTNTDEYNFES